MNTLPAVRPPRQRQKPVRFARLFRESSGDFLRLREVFAKRPDQIDLYEVHDFPSEIGGRGVQLTKTDGTHYNLLIDGQQSTCDCKGFESHGWHKGPDGEPVACKHVMALLGLDGQQPSASAVEQPLDSAEKPWGGCRLCGGDGYLRDQHRATVCRCSCWGF